MSSGVAKRQRRQVRKQEGVPKRHDLAALKTARRAQAQLQGARAQVMAKLAVKDGTSRALTELKVEHKAALRTITDLKWALVIVSFVLGSAVVLFMVEAVM